MPGGWTTETADVVVFGIVPWTSRWQRPQHLAAELTRRGHRVVYVTPHLVTGRERFRELEEESCPEGVVLAQLAAIDKATIHADVDWSDGDASHVHHTFWRMADTLRLRCPILLVQSPGWWPLLSWLRERTDFPVVYDCLDEHTGWNQAHAPRTASLGGGAHEGGRPRARLLAAAARPPAPAFP